MNKEQLIALGVTEEQANAIVEGFGQMIPHARFNQKVEEANKLKEALAQRDEQLEQLKADNEGNASLKDEIAKLQQANEAAQADFEKKVNDMQFDYELREALRSAKVKDPTDIIGQLKRDELQFEGGAFKGLEEQLNSLKEGKPYLFVEEGLKGRTPNRQAPPPKETGMTREEYAKLSYGERIELHRENPNIVNELK